MKKQRLLFSVLFILSALFPFSSSAMDVIDHSSSVFKFQQKLANSGNAQAQYKLGYLYETGEGIEASLDKALHWYERSASQGFRAAEQRRDYLMIRELGYNKKTNKAWLDSVKQDAAAHKEPALLLLGQLYHKGIGVKKDLDRSLTLLNEVASLGSAGVDKEIAIVQAELDAVERRRRAAEKKVLANSAAGPATTTASVKTKPTPVKPATVKQTSIDKKAAVQPTPSKKSQAQLIAEQKAEKKRRYEMVMEQIRREQQLIDEQQASVSGEDVASVDDEI